MNFTKFTLGVGLDSFWIRVPRRLELKNHRASSFHLSCPRICLGGKLVHNLGAASSNCSIAFFLFVNFFDKNTAKNKATDSERETIIEMHNLFPCFPTPKA
jgi:hypothetical protein